MADSKPLNDERTVTLESGRQIKMQPLAWYAFQPLLKSIWNSHAELLTDMAKSGIDARTIAGTLMAMVGKPEEWTVLAAPTTVVWIVGGSIDGMKRDESGAPDFDGWSFDEVTEALEYALKITDMTRLGARLKNLLLPAVGAISAAVGGGETESSNRQTDGTSESPSKSVDGTDSKEST